MAHFGMVHFRVVHFGMVHFRVGNVHFAEDDLVLWIGKSYNNRK